MKSTHGMINQSSVILSYIQTRSLLEAHKRGLLVIEISPDLGRSIAHVTLNTDGVSFPTGEYLDWPSIKKISQSDTKCYLIDAGKVQPIQIFSHETNRLCSLFPTQGTPSMLISGFVMHRIKDIDPMQHAQRMIATIAPIRGSVLDTTTGLGYTSILAAKSAHDVTTIELDPGVQSLAHLNPWSQELFTSPNIQRIIGNAYEVVPTFADERFDRIMHDPPMFKLAGELYSTAFYQELHRLLRRGGKLFHYVGDPNSKASSNITKGVMRRLREVGFSRVVQRTDAYGMVAYK